MRYIVEQGQPTGSKQNTVLSGYCAARRFTRLISVPTAMADPAGALAISLTMYAVEPVPSAASTTCIEHSGCTITLTPGNAARAFSICSTVKRWCTEQKPFHRIILALA